MKPNELQIGDFAACEGKNGKVKELREHKLLLKTENSVMIVYYNNVEPIPLTVEILEKNGVKCEEIIQPHWISEDGRILLRNDESLINSNNKWSVHVDNEDMQTIGYFEITYVHELQHALRLAGMEKTIEL